MRVGGSSNLEPCLGLGSNSSARGSFSADDPSTEYLCTTAQGRL
jgi:hypothetical protein